jgi:hypothetical protein
VRRRKQESNEDAYGVEDLVAAIQQKESCVHEIG